MHYDGDVCRQMQKQGAAKQLQCPVRTPPLLKLETSCNIGNLTLSGLWKSNSQNAVDSWIDSWVGRQWLAMSYNVKCENVMLSI